jgi:predicted metal-dependent phosphoesterase TrpH
MWKVDLHAHSQFSSDGLIPLDELIRRARQAGLDKLAITDHNTIAGALAAREMAPDFIIVGEEIKTTQGELLGFFLTREVPRGLSPEETIARLRDQGAAISVSHPFDRLRSGAWKVDDLTRIVPLVDALEGFNARCLFGEDNDLAAAFARESRLRQTAGSDCHERTEVGRAGVELEPFRDALTFVDSLRGAQTFGKLSPWWVHLFSTYAKWKRKAARRLRRGNQP